MAQFVRAIVLLVALSICQAIDLAKYRQDDYFGTQTVKSGEPLPQDNTEVRPWNISVPESDLAYLKERLADARYIDHLPDTAFRYGMNANTLKDVVKYWNSTYDWRKQEAMLNSYPNFKTQIEGIDIHFVHVKADPSAKTIIPLITLHGWPSTFYEVYKSIPSLTKPDADGIAYEVIAPSLPGFGYSEAAHKKGMDNVAAARIFVKLMKRLGHEKFLLQGGDWGSIISRAMAILYPENTIGIHVLGLFDAMENFLSFKRLARNLFTPHLPTTLNPAAIKKELEKVFPLKEKLLQGFEETGVLHWAATKPDTLAALIADSPVGLAAHILEKYSTFVQVSNRNLENGGLNQKWTMDELLNVVMIYWTSPNLAGSTRIYKETVQANTGVTNEVIKVPAGVVDAPNEMIQSPRFLVEGNYAQLLQYTDLPEGGHFMVFEVPDLIEKDLRSLTKKILKK